MNVPYDDMTGATWRRRILLVVLGHADRLFDTLEGRWESPRTRQSTTTLLILAFLGALVLIELNRQGLLPPTLVAWMPRNHFEAINLAFTFFLAIEIVGLIFALARSVSNSVGKQFEIFSLILLRTAFKEFSYFEEPVTWEAIEQPVRYVLVDGLAALLLFGLVGAYYRMQRHRPITQDEVEQRHFVSVKKVIALLLLVAFVWIGMVDLWRAMTGQPTFPFFETFYTILIFSDVLIVLISLRYTDTYHVIFRNAGFALATVLLRVALTAPPLERAGLGVGALVFAIGLTFAYHTYGPGDVPGRDEGPPHDAHITTEEKR